MRKPRELETYLLNMNSEATRKAYEIDITQFIEFMDNVYEDVRTIDIVNPYHVNGFLKKLKNEKWAPKTINRKMASNLNFFEFLISKKIISKNHWLLVERLDDVVQNPTTTVSPDDVKKLLDSIDGNREASLLHQAILFTLFTTGIKKGELIRLKIEDFQEENDTYFLEIKNKSNASARIKLSAKCASKIERYLDEMIIDKMYLDPSSWLFRPSKNPSDTNNLNKPMNPKSVDYVIKTWCNRAGLGKEISSHSARKIRIEKEIEKNPNAKVITKKFGITEQTYFRHKLTSDPESTFH